jgi:cytochrome c peroxidase
MHRDKGDPLHSLLLALIFSLACTATLASQAAESVSPSLLGLPTPPASHKGPESRAQAALGKRLFFDARFSADEKIRCASCHQPEKAFSDGLRVSQGMGGRNGTRNAPSLINVVFASSLFWDGRRDTLEAQALDPFINPNEHDLVSLDALAEKVRADEAYRDAFATAFGHNKKQTITAERIGLAIAAYLQTLVAGGSSVDRYLYGGEKHALTPAAVRGLELFRGRAGCAECHVIGARDAMLSDGKFHSLGVGMEDIRAHLAELATRAMRREAPLDHTVLQDGELAELGRFLVTRDPHDIGKFKTPSLRNVALTAPYMHNGRVATLEEAVEREIYYRGLTTNRPLIVTPNEKEDLVAFLRSLTSNALPLLSGE